MIRLAGDRTLDPGSAQFWDACARDEIRLPRCRQCGKLQWPITASCDRCDGEAFRWEILSGRGSLASWCSFHQDYYKGRFPLPYDTILVELEEGPLFISNPEGFGRDAMRAGLPLTVRFVDAEDAAGRFRLPVFAAADPES